MKTILVIALLVASLAAAAQEEKSIDFETENTEPYTPAATTDDDDTYLNGMVPVAAFTPEEPQLPDSLHLPTVDYNGHIPSNHYWNYPYLGGLWGWNLHEGLNASLYLSAFTSFGHHHFSGTAERISAMYATALNDRLSLAIGGYFTNMNTNHGTFRAGGLSAILDYRFNEHWEAYIYAQKNLLRDMSGRFRPGYGIDAFDYFGNMNDRIGLGLRYNFNETTFLEVQIDLERRPSYTPQLPTPAKQTGDNLNRSIEKNNPLPSQQNSRR